MVPGIVLAAPHKGPSNVDRRFPLDKAYHLRHRVLRRNGEEHVHVIRHQVPLFNPTFLLRGQRPEDLPEMPPQLMVERFPTILRDKHHMILAVPRGMIQSLDVWHDRLPLSDTLSGSREGVCRFDSRSCQTLGVPRQSRGFTLGNYTLSPIMSNILTSRPVSLFQDECRRAKTIVVKGPRALPCRSRAQRPRLTRLCPRRSV